MYWDVQSSCYGRKQTPSRDWPTSICIRIRCPLPNHTMANLPPELVPSIIGNHSTSLALALVNKYYNDIVTQILYKDVALFGVGTLKKFSVTMAAGRPFLRKYPVSLRINSWPYSWGGIVYLLPDIKQTLMHVPNLQYLNIFSAGDDPIPRYLVEEPQYPFRLRQILITPFRDSVFVKFLETQPEIEEIIFGVIDGDGTSRGQTWRADITPLQPKILPKLRSIQSHQSDISFMVPHHPVSEITLFETHRDTEIHKEIAKSSVPLKRLAECVEISEQPWESGLVLRWLPSLEFCWRSLSEYSLEIDPFPQRDFPCSICSFLKEREAPSYGLDALRNSLSAFSVLKKFNFNFRNDSLYDLTPEFCQTVPELSRFDVWQESCPSLVEVSLFKIILKEM
ncbi:unnamed protein product [Rhizoctonia solani]|uniref:Uncharacterized protein n=1 Tax=Rhizoctonia solani TaxID=456999 RepID=A0A8H3HIR5_9AGAM|nr:unnamed protein product [Rhizoctonia solani]